MRAITIKIVVNAILGALRQAAPERIPAEPSAQLAVVHFGGIGLGGEKYITSQLLAGGTLESSIVSPAVSALTRASL